MSILREIQQNIESNRNLQAVFPKLKPDMPWSASELQVKRDPGVILKDATFVGVGLHGGLTGKRADLIVVDDPFDESEVRTEAQRKKVEDWIEKVLIPTLTPKGEIVFVGTPWHYDDYWSQLEAKSVENGGLYVIRKYPAIQDYSPDTPIAEWKVQWPEVWSAARLAERKTEIGSVKFACLYLLDPSGFEGALFKREWLAYFNPNIFNDTGFIQDFEYYMAVDPNVSDNPESARMAIVTIAFDRARGDIYVLDVFAEPMDFPSQMKKIIEYGRRTRIPFIPYDVKIRKVGIESNTWQQIVSKAAYASGLPIKEIKQKQTKHERLVGIQPHFENGRFKFPDRRFGVNWWDKFESEYLAYPLGKYKDIMDGIELAFTTAEISVEPAGPNFAFGNTPRWGGMR
jgi:predicted phage terminase large subunit-like protein